MPDVARTTCDGCGEEVLVVELACTVAVIERTEVMPPGPCPRCAVVEGRGDRPSGGCSMCGGTRRVGQRLPHGHAVRLAEDGRARPHYPDRGRNRGEAVHRYHQCQGALAEAV